MRHGMDRQQFHSRWAELEHNGVTYGPADSLFSAFFLDFFLERGWKGVAAVTVLRG